MNDFKETNLKGALDYAITMLHIIAKEKGIELTDYYGVWETIKEEYNIE